MPVCAQPDAMPAEAEAGWWRFYGLLNRDGPRKQRDQARDEFARSPDDRACAALWLWPKHWNEWKAASLMTSGRPPNCFYRAECLLR